MKMYTIRVEIIASGYQYFEVSAGSCEEALKIFETAGGDFLDEELDVNTVTNPTITDEY